MENYDHLLIYLVNEFIKRKGIKDADREQFLNEARVAAWKAVTDFQVEKNVKITTYISTCVNNHLSNVNKERSRSKKRFIRAKESSKIDYYHTRRSGQSIEDFEFTLTMKALLTEREFQVFELRFVQDCQSTEIQKALGVGAREVEKCLSSIVAKYQSLEQSLQENLTQIQLRNRWLESSQE